MKGFIVFSVLGLMFAGCSTTSLGSISTKPFHPNKSYERVNYQVLGSSTQLSILGFLIGPESDFFQATNDALNKGDGDIIINPRLVSQFTGFDYGGIEWIGISNHSIEGEVWRESK